MDNVLAKLPIVKEDRKTVSKYVLLNLSRVIDWFENSAGQVELYFNDISDRKDKCTEYVTSLDRHTFETYFEEVQPNNFQTFNIDKWNLHPIGNKSAGDLKPFPYSHGKINLNLDSFVKAESLIDETGSIVWFARGAFNYVAFKTTNTLDEINTSSSNSGSLE